MVRVNVMWFSSLVFSLVAAMLSILCKEWLDGYGVGNLFHVFSTWSQLKLPW